MPKLSILLPSLRPDELKKRIVEFSATHPRMDYELVVVSPFLVSGEKIVHILETEPRGVLYAMNEALKKASSDYIVLWSDDASPIKDCLQNILAFVKKNEKNLPFAAGFSKVDSRGEGFGQWRVYGKLYVGWACASKRTIEAVGGLFDPDYRNYWGDPDFSLRVWEKGGTVAVCKDAYIEVVQINDKVKTKNLSTCFEKDTQTFFNKWHDKLGKGRKKVWWKINCEIPNSFSDHLRAFLRNLPYLKELKKWIIPSA
jgi:glycosyltransferase involved in cell wall biosynthesis